MKRTLIGLAAVTVAIWLCSFSLRQDSHLAQYYWFPLQAGTGWPQPTQFLIYQSGCPDRCGNFGTPYCDGGFTGYYGSGPYYATGIEVFVTHNWPQFPTIISAAAR